ncbi:MAG: TrmB family transcriptional regulator [Candidatus Baldrarchaeia archaeon]
MEDTEIFQALRGLGLTEYEVRVYITLLENGSMTAAEISSASGIPYSRIYEVLTRLEKKGWIEALSSRPKLYKPLPPSEAVKIVKIELERQLENYENVVIEKLQPLYEKQALVERPDVYIIRGIENVLARVIEMFEDAKKKVMISMSNINIEYIKVIEDALRNIKNRNIKIEILTSTDSSPEALSRLSKYGEIRIRDRLYGGGVIVDDHEVMLLLMGKSSVLAIWSTHIELATLARDYFYYLWNMPDTISFKGD